MIAWVEQHPDSPRWPIGWFNLFEIRKSGLTHEHRRRLFIAACKWIAADDERDYAPFVLTHIILNLSGFRAISDEFGLVNRARDVLSRTVETDDRNWTGLWFAVSRHVKTWPSAQSSVVSDNLRTLGRRWLAVSGRLSGGSWSQVYRCVYRISTDDERVHRELAIKGIVRGLIPDSAPFAAFLYSNAKCEEPPDELIQWLDQWFAGPSRESGGFSVWLRLDHSTRDALARRPEGQWLKLRNVLNRHRPDQAAHWEAVIERYRQRQPIVGRVVKTVRQKKWGRRPKRLGYVVDIGTNAFLSLEEAAIEPASESGRLAIVGQSFEFDIIRLDEQRLQVDVSRRTLLERRQKEALAALSIGTVVEGCVKHIKDYGVFVDLGFIDGLLHVSEMGERYQGHPSDLFEVGQHLVTRVLTVDVSRRRVSLTMKFTQASQTRND